MAMSNRCELCGMLAEHSQRDEHGVIHYYCSHHRPATPAADHKAHDKHAGHTPELFRKKFWISLTLTIPVVIYSEVFGRWFGFTPPAFAGSQFLPLVFGSAIFFYGGVIFLKGALAELKARLPGMMTLISLAILSAYAYSVLTTFVIEGTEFFWELATLITVMLFGHWMEMRSVSQAQGALGELAKLLPDIAELDNGKHVPVAQLKVGDRLQVRPGGKVPADGVVVEGNSSLNESMITGESRPVDKKKGEHVIAGTINGNGSLKIKVSQVGEATVLAGIMRLVSQAQQSRSKAQIVADKAAFVLTITAIITGGGALLAWLWAGAGLAFALERTVGVLVIACPHALGLAVPLVTAISTAKGARSGLLVRDRKALEAARSVDVVLFDKTGTLTKGEQGVTDIVAKADRKQSVVLATAAAVEQFSEHLIARAIVAAAKQRKLRLPQAVRFKSLPGKGVQAAIGGKLVAVGGPQLVSGQRISVPAELAKTVRQLSAQGKTVVYVIAGKQVIGILALADVIRPESAGVIDRLKKLGIQVAMVTGDSADVAAAVAGQLGIKDYFSEVLPEHKIDKVKQLQAGGVKVAMVGDGVNDAPALTQANVGIAIGAGTDVAIESAGIILVRSDPRDVVKIVELARATYRKMVENLIWASGYNIVAIPLAAGVLANQGIVLAPAFAALLMSISTVIVALNAQLLRRLKL